MDLTTQVHTSRHRSLACRTVLIGLSLLRASLIKLILVLVLLLMVDQSTERCSPVEVTPCSSASQSVRKQYAV